MRPAMDIERIEYEKMCRIGSKRLLAALHKHHPIHMAKAREKGRLVVYP
jgi:hypothetical protein